MFYVDKLYFWLEITLFLNFKETPKSRIQDHHHHLSSARCVEAAGISQRSALSTIVQKYNIRITIFKVLLNLIHYYYQYQVWYDCFQQYSCLLLLQYFGQNDGGVISNRPPPMPLRTNRCLIHYQWPIRKYWKVFWWLLEPPIINGIHKYSGRGVRFKIYIENTLRYVSSGGTLINYLCEPQLRMMTARTGRQGRKCRKETLRRLIHLKVENLNIWTCGFHLIQFESNPRYFILHQLVLVVCVASTKENPKWEVWYFSFGLTNLQSCKMS